VAAEQACSSHERTGNVLESGQERGSQSLVGMDTGGAQRMWPPYTNPPVRDRPLKSDQKEDEDKSKHKEGPLDVDLNL